MTKQKKFKKKVRARMKETGGRFTEVRAEHGGHMPDYTVEATARRIVLEAHSSWFDGRLVQEVKNFHEHHRWDTEWGRNTDSLLLYSEILEVVRPLDVTTQEDMLAKVQNIFDLWLRGGLPEGSRVLPLTHEVDPLWNLEVNGLSVVAPTHDRLLDVPAEEDEWYESEGLPPAASLDSLWKKSPDVSAVFFGRRLSQRALQAEDLARCGQTRYAKEIERLRAKLEAAGIDPDA